MSTPKIILVEPAGALNVGSVARVMKNMGLDRLVLVNPQCDPHASEARQMAVHGIEVLEQATIVPDLPSALIGCQRAIATTARSRTLPMNLESPRLALPWLLEDQISSALIFGPEDRGLSNSELNHAQRFVGIPANPEYPSLNLAQAVAVCVYELYQISLEKDIDTSNSCANLQGEEVTNFSPVSVDYASLDTIEGYYQHLETVLLEIGYLYPHTAAARMEKFRRLYYRANLSNEEVAMLRGILSQIQWAIKSNCGLTDRETSGDR
ncbi:RNA methyltransferase, TrmH family, group 1 [Stanieria sp. NIES-3757]|nr:RNA methyltransferase, TrmH family, group 1 [Stanieria sp. NIES-3757]